MFRTHSGQFLAGVFLAAGVGMGQAQDEDFRVYTEHPRLFLQARRIRLLKRERERRSMRWEQFETLMAGKARMPEPGFAWALYARVTGSAAHCRQAVEWALTPAADLRQRALVFDWCQAEMSVAQSKELAARLARGIEETRRSPDIADVRSRVLAAVALADHLPQVSERELRAVVVDWWRRRMVPALQSGRAAIPLHRTYELFELLHGVRDNLNLELRESLAAVFKELPAGHVLSHYPAPYPSAENDYRIAALKGGGEPDLRAAALSRAAGLAMVAYDTNAQENQFLQGWLIQDRYNLRGAFGAPYEFLWANPYQPGLSPFYLPLLIHDSRAGRLFVRSTWEDDARWFGFLDGEAQMFEQGRVTVIHPPAASKPIEVGPAVILFARDPLRFRLGGQEETLLFLVGLRAHRRYDVEVDDEEMREEEADAGGVLKLALPEKYTGGLRLREIPAPRPPR